MAQSAGLHEDATLIAPATVERHRAIVSFQEELEAIDDSSLGVGSPRGRIQ